MQSWIRRDTQLLYCASAKGYTEIVEALIKAGAVLDVKDNDGKTALDYAKEFGYTKVTRILKQAQQKTKSKSTSSGATKIASQESVFAKVTKGISKILRNEREA